MLKLNLGCGLNQKPKEEGWVNIDCRDLPGVDKVCDIRKLDYPDASVDEIFANDVLEHISWRETKKVLAEWARVLKPGGKIYIQSPDIEAIAKKILSGEIKEEGIGYWVFGSADYGEPSFHKAGFTKKFLKKLLEEVGIRVERIENDGGTNLMCWGIKQR